MVTAADTIPAAAGRAVASYADRMAAVPQGGQRVTFAEYVAGAEAIARRLGVLAHTRFKAGTSPRSCGTRAPQHQLLYQWRSRSPRRGYVAEACALDVPDLRAVLTVDTADEWGRADGPSLTDRSQVKDIAAVPHTSGATGRPRGAMLRHDAMVRGYGGWPAPHRHTTRPPAIGAMVIPWPTVDTRYDVIGIQDVHVPDGFTEVSALDTLSRQGGSREMVCTTAGRPLPDIMVRILADHGREVADGQTGDIEVSGYAVMPAYLDPTSGGPLGPGCNVNPGEVEACLLDCPAVNEAAVVGHPDDRLGEVAVDFVVAGSEDTAVSADLCAWRRERVANLTLPRDVRWVDLLPINAAGQVVNDELRSRLVGSDG